MINDTKEEEISSRKQIYKNTTRIQIHMSTYMYFDGTASVWTGVKVKIEALLEAQGLNELVNIMDEDAHILNIDVEEGYEETKKLYIQS